MLSPALRVSRRILGIDPNDPSLVLYLPFYYTGLQGTSFKSMDLNRHTCTVSGPVWGQKGRYFDGNDDYISVPKATPINNLTEFTWEAWISPSSAADRLIEKASAPSMRIEVTTRKLQGYIYNSGGGTNANTKDDNGLPLYTWVHTAMTFSLSGDKKIYLWKNGILVTAYTSQVALVGTPGDDSGDNLIIGTFPGATNDFGGYIGEVRIYNRVLTAPEIRRNYEATKGRY